MSPTVLKLKGKEMLSFLLQLLTQTFAILLPLALSIFPSPLAVTWLKLGVILHPLYLLSCCFV
jgi:hypothetical protein